MVKTDEHMQRIKKKLTDEATAKRAGQEARKLRDAKKFGKQVQVAREQERAKEKRETLGKIQELKRKRKDAPGNAVNEGDNLFQEINIDRDDDDRATKRPRKDGKGGRDDGNHKRQAKDKKFGFGGKKRFAKSGDAASSADMRGFDQRRMKGKPAGAGRGGKRLGKSRRQGGQS
ncbi:rRNA-processing protein EBP2 [Elasticomyces elasticus]|nr:rRNA-processing protein EBP2 [Elasticomyces elasticus]